MKLTILGSGTMVPAKDRYPSSYLIEHQSTKLLLDCGTLATARLLETSVDIQDIDAVLVTHFHADHFGGLLPLIHARFVDDFYTGNDHQHMTAIGPNTLSDRWHKLREVFWAERDEDPPLTFHEGPNKYNIGSITVEAFSVNHVEWFSSVGYRISVGDGALAYTGDMRSNQDDAFISAIKGVNLLLIEAAALSPTKTHLTASQAVGFARQAGVEKVVLTHISSIGEKPAKAIAAQQPDFVTVAKDGAVFEL